MAQPPDSGEMMEHHPSFFTYEEATRTLPLVERIVRDIVAAYPAFQRHLQQFHQFATTPQGPGSEERLTALREQIDRESDQINSFIRELHQIGCLFKGFDEGLVDFYTLYQGRPIFLCWKLGEDGIRHWHEVESGFAGRQPIENEMEEALREVRTVNLDSTT